MQTAVSALGIALLIANVFVEVQTSQRPILDPSQGDGGVSAFYVWDKTVPGSPGQLLRQEPLPETLALANASKGLRVLYTSTNGINAKSPVAVSGSIYFPKGQAPTGGWPIVAWAHGMTGIADVCAPSWAPRSQRDIDYLNAWLAQGFAIAATDYQGLGTPGGHPAGVVKAEAYGVLDSVRSALPAFPELSNSVVVVGQSQGARAALTASLLADRYAPSLRVRGTVATGVPQPYLPDTNAPRIPVPRSNNARSVVLNLFTFLALDPAFTPSEYLSQGAKVVFEAGRTRCVVDLAQVVDQNLVTVENALVKNPDAAAANAAPYQRYPSPRFAQPVFIGMGLADVVAFPQGQYNFVKAACHAGSKVEAHYYPGMDHAGAVNGSLVDSVPFVKRVLAGQSVDGNCESVRPPSSGI